MATGLDHLLSNLGYLKRQEDNVCLAMFGAPMNDVINAMAQQLQWSSDTGVRTPKINTLLQPTQPTAPQEVGYSADSVSPQAPSNLATPSQASSLNGFKRQVFEAVDNAARKMSASQIAEAKRTGRTITMVDINRMQGGE